MRILQSEPVVLHHVRSPSIVFPPRCLDHGNQERHHFTGCYKPCNRLTRIHSCAKNVNISLDWMYKSIEKVYGRTYPESLVWETGKHYMLKFMIKQRIQMNESHELGFFAAVYSLAMLIHAYTAVVRI